MLKVGFKELPEVIKFMEEQENTVLAAFKPSIIKSSENRNKRLIRIGKNLILLLSNDELKRNIRYKFKKHKRKCCTFTFKETTGVKVCKFLENVQKLYSNNVAEGIKNKYPNAPLLEFAEESEMSTRRAMVDKS